MRTWTHGPSAGAMLGIVLLTSPAHGVEAWRISELFSDADGRVQYLELTTASNGQENLSGRVLRSFDAAGVPGQSFTFPSNLTSALTAGRTVLIGTRDFAGLAQLPMDYEIPSGFLNTEGGRVQLVDIHEVAYERQLLPRNGAQSFHADGRAASASPQNFSGQTTSVDIPVIASFDTATGMLLLPVVEAPGVGIVNARLQLTQQDPPQFTLSDVYFYDTTIDAGTRSARVEGNGLLHMPSVRVGAQLFEVTMSLLPGEPIRFGDIAVLSVMDEPPVPAPPPVQTPTPTPAPSPTPNALEDSIAAGQIRYQQLCSGCHGNTGGGGAAPSVNDFDAASFNNLRAIINSTMPQGNPGACADNATSTCATDVANYIINRL